MQFLRHPRRRNLLFAVLLALFGGPALVGVSGAVSLDADWRTARRDSADLAPAPRAAPEAVVQVYAARAFNWRGLFAVHTWIATKREGASAYAVHQVLGWNEWRGLPVVESGFDIPDRYWYGARPELVRDVRGAAAAALIPDIEEAIRRYPDVFTYRLWPGPNSNSFIAFVGREVPGLDLNLPVTAIGKDYLNGGGLVAPAPSGSGYQVSLGGALGVLIAAQEGIEINLLGLVFGLDLLRPALKLPGIGRLGLPARATAPDGR